MWEVRFPERKNGDSSTGEVYDESAGEHVDDSCNYGFAIVAAPESSDGTAAARMSIDRRLRSGWVFASG